MRATIFLMMAFQCFSVAAQNRTETKIEQLIREAQYSQALTEIESELSAGENMLTPFLQNQKAQVQILLGKLEEAESTIRQIKSKDALAEAITLSNLGFLQLNKSRYDLAVESLQESWAKFQSIQQQNTREAAACLSNLALVYNTLGKQNQALEYETIALQTRLKLFGETSEEVAASYNDLGLIYSLTDLDKALEMYEKAQKIYQQLHGDNHPKLAIVATNIGVNYQRLKLYGDAINNFETAQKIWQKIYPNGHPNQAIVLRNLATTYGLLNNEKAALGYFQQALEMYKKSYGEKHPDIAGTYNELGRFLLNGKKFEESLTSYQNALRANAISFSEANIKNNPRVRENFYNERVGLFSLHLKALALEERHYGKTLKLGDLKSALNCLYLCDSLIDNIRQHSSEESDKLALGELANEVYEDGVRVANTISELTLGSKEFLEHAFYFAEKSKSAVLQESIADAQAKSFAGIPQDLLEQEKNLKSQIALLTQKLSQKPSVDEEKKLRQDLFNTNSSYQQFISQLEKNFPNYFNLKYSRSKISIADLQQSLDPGIAVVSYFIAERNKRLYQFVISQKNFNVTNALLPDDFERYIKGFNNSLFFGNLPTYQAASKVLFKLLNPKIPSSIREVVIIPSGSLATLPFEALPTSRLSDQDFANMPYLIKKVGVSYDFSASLFLQKNKQEKTRSQPSVFLCAPIKFDESMNLADLPGTENEVMNISNMFPSASKTVKFSDANESLIKSKEISQYSYLHFATHGVVDEENPEMSSIFLSNSANDDGNLFAGEIYNLNLNANLAVLSACQTGLGKISKGEGVIGLSRALIYAGAKNIIVSFWTVADESTSVLMTNFYKELATKPNEDFNRCLQRAKLKMIEEGKFASPYYWAPFVLIGD